MSSNVVLNRIKNNANNTESVIKNMKSEVQWILFGLCVIVLKLTTDVILTVKPHTVLKLLYGNFDFFLSYKWKFAYFT